MKKQDKNKKTVRNSVPYYKAVSGMSEIPFPLDVTYFVET